MYRKNVAGQNLGFCLVNASSGAAVTGATVTVKKMVDGAAQAAATGTVSEGGSGQYNLALSQADTNGNQISFLFTATGAIPVEKTIVTTAADPTDAVHFGLTCLPNTAVTTNGSLLTSGAGTAQLSVASGQVILQAGTGTGQLDFTAGVVKANLAQILGTALTETAGQIAAGFKKFFNIATPASTMDALTLVATATNLTNAPTAGDFTAAMKTSLNAATPASVTGAVGSVTGAVGSVTGNVGGSVASVTADVGITQAAADKVFGSSGATLAELAQAQPPTNPRPDQALMLLYMAIRNALTTTASSKTISNNAGTVICKQTLSDDGTTYTQTKLATGP